MVIRLNKMKLIIYFVFYRGFNGKMNYTHLNISCRQNKYLEDNSSKV